MSDHARSTLSRMHMRPQLIAPHYLGLPNELHLLTLAVHERAEEDFARRRGELCSAYGLAQVEQRKPFAFSSGIAIIPVHGTLINRFPYSWGYVTGYNFIRQQAAMAGQDPDVKGIVYDHNSFGGEAAGCFECSADIKRLANGKPTVAIVDSNCYSASYAMACGADRIIVTPSGGAGSIGVVAMHVNFEKLLAEMGIEVTFITAGAHKVDGNPFETLSDEAKAEIQKSIDATMNAFVNVVVTGRRMEEKAVRGTEARIYRAEDALSLGLVDAIAAPNEAMQAFLDELSGSNTQLRTKGDDMSTTTNSAEPKAPTEDQLAASAKAAATAERARISGIQSCDESKGRETLARHLSVNTDLSIDAARAILAASPKEQQAAAPNPLTAAMDATANPKVGADPSGSADTKTPEAEVNSWLADVQRAGVIAVPKH